MLKEWYTYTRVSNNRTKFSAIYYQIKMSHSIHMLSFQIDTKNLQLVY